MLALVATLAIQAFVTMSVLTPAVYAALAAPEIGVGANQIGIFTSIVYAAACLAAAYAGPPLRRFGPIRLSQLCMLGCALGVTLTASASLVPVMLGAVALGLGYGPVTPASSHLLIRRSPPERRALIFSIKQTGVPVGGALAGIMIPALVLALGWKGAALATAAIGVALVALVQPLRAGLDADDEPAATGGRSVFASLRLVLGEPSLRRLALGSLAFASMQLCFGSFIVTFLTERVGMALVTAGLIMAAAQVAGIGGRILWGWAADRLLPPGPLLALLGIGMAVTGTATGFITAAWPVGLIVAVTLALGITALSWNGVYLAEVARLAPAGAAGAATGGALSLTFLGVVIGPPIFSAVVAWSGSYRPAFIAAAATTAAAALAIGRRGAVDRSG